jgi:hypothetical protein
VFVASLSGRVRGAVLAVVTLVALLGSLLAVVSPPAPAQAAVTGDGGQFVTTTGRVLETRDGAADTASVDGETAVDRGEGR